MLALIEKHLPTAQVRLWPKDIGDGVEAMLLRRFPALEVVRSDEQLAEAFEQCDLLLHGSGPFLVGAAELERWRDATHKPYGIYGITLGSAEPRSIELINNAAFAFFRDSISLELAREHARCPIMQFAADGAFAVDLRDDEAAEAFLARHDLEQDRFVCCIPRLRHTPYWLIHRREMNAEDRRKHEVNESMKEHDHAPLREAITAVVKRAGMKVLICPEDKSQMLIGRELLLDLLPAAVRESVVLREDFWLTDEALSTYVRSAGLFGNEMHSPIMCIGNGIPAIVCRWSEQTSKGFMWRDIGLGEWLFDIDEPGDRARIAETVIAMVSEREAAQARVEHARAIVRRRQRETMQIIGHHLS